MTDSLKLSLDLTKLPLHARLQIPLVVGSEINPRSGELLSRKLKPTKGFSPMSNTRTWWLVRSEKLFMNEQWEDVATSVEADLNLANALTGQNLEHGTSVFAAGVGALYLIKIWLATAGLDRMYLNRLTEADIKLVSVTLTYLISCLTNAEARALVHDIRTTAHILSSRAESYKSSNETVNLHTKHGRLGAYHKTLLKFCKFATGAPTADILDANALLVRLESKLNSAFLAKTGLTSLLSWKDAYADGLYELFFQKTVLEPLQLDLRHNRPRPEALASLTPMEAEFVLHYLDGGDCRTFSNVAQAAFPVQTLSKLRIAVRRKLFIDTDIPWTEHTKLRCFKLKDQLVYPGDYFPPAERAAWCFCKQSWPQLLQKLSDRLDAALAPMEWAPAYPRIHLLSTCQAAL